VKGHIKLHLEREAFYLHMQERGKNNGKKGGGLWILYYFKSFMECDLFLNKIFMIIWFHFEMDVSKAFMKKS
jgi:hypothetical protein